MLNHWLYRRKRSPDMCHWLVSMVCISHRNFFFFKLPTCHPQLFKILNTWTIGSREPCQAALPWTSTEHLTTALQPGTLGAVIDSLLSHQVGGSTYISEGFISEHMLFRNTDYLGEIQHRGMLAHMWREKVL